MHDTQSPAPSYTREEFLSSQTLELADSAVLEIFEMMLGMDVTPVSDAPIPFGTTEHAVKTAIVGFSGSLRGGCELRMTSAAAAAIAAVMLDSPLVQDDDTAVADVVGELCNMIAGGWKNRTPTLSRSCSLSPPCVISGTDYKVSQPTLLPRLFQAYRFDDFTFHLTLTYENEPAF